MLAIRERLIVERALVLAARAGICGPGSLAGVSLCDLVDLDPGELQSRADGALNLIEALEVFVSKLPEVEARVRDGDVAKGVEVFNVGQRVIVDLGGYSPVLEVTEDVRQLARDLKRSASGALSVGAGAVGLVVAVVVAKEVLS